jgi:hypothetical protein
MVMIGHQAVRMADPAESLNDFSKYLEEKDAIVIIDIDLLSRIATRSNMIQSTLELNPQWPCHEKKIVEQMKRNNNWPKMSAETQVVDTPDVELQDLTPFFIWH